MEHRVTIGATFRCDVCQEPAKIVVDNPYTRVERVFCPSCGNAVEGDAADLMYDTLIKRRGVQMGRNLNRGTLGVSLADVDYEFSDPAWRFVLVIDENV